MSGTPEGFEPTPEILKEYHDSRSIYTSCMTRLSVKYAAAGLGLALPLAYYKATSLPLLAGALLGTGVDYYETYRLCDGERARVHSLADKLNAELVAFEEERKNQL
jgi:hypothetical protein